MPVWCLPLRGSFCGCSLQGTTGHFEVFRDDYVHAGSSLQDAGLLLQRSAWLNAPVVSDLVW